MTLLELGKESDLRRKWIKLLTTKHLSYLTSLINSISFNL